MLQEKLKMPKQLLFNDDARQKLLSGINLLADAVTTTLGPRGQNVALDRKWGVPSVVHDGVSVAKEIELNDPFENMGAQLVKEAASKTNDAAGDGTTTATLLAQKMVQVGMKNIAAGANPMFMKKGIDIAIEAVVAGLMRVKKDVKPEDWVKVATVSAQSEKIGKKIARAIKAVGDDGFVDVERSEGFDIQIEHTKGMELDKGYISPYFVNAENDECIIEKANIVLTDKTISALEDIVPILDLVKDNLVLIAENVDGQALTTLVVNKIRGAIKVVAIKNPGFGEKKNAVLDDIAAMTGATVLSEDTDRKLDSITEKDVGHADRVVVDNKVTRVIGSKGDTKKRLQSLKNQLKSLDSEFEKDKLKQRIAKLSGGVAVIKVGAASETEQKEVEERVKDALGATRAAIEEGIVPGGGVAYLRGINALKGLEADGDVMVGINIVRQALKEPIRRLASNSEMDAGIVLHRVMKSKNLNYGFNVVTLKFGDMIEMGILDPVKVVKSALVNAASVASMILTTQCLITDIKTEEKPDEKR